MSAVPVFNVEGSEGGTVTIQVQVQEASGAASNLTGYTGSMQVRSAVLSDVVLATGTVTISAGTGVVTAVIADEDTVDWSSGVYDIRITSGAGVVEYICRGAITLAPSVTH